MDVVERVVGGLDPTLADVRLAGLSVAGATGFGTAAGVTMFRSREGLLRVFSIRSDGQIFQQSRGSGWTVQELFGGPFRGAPGVAYRPADHRFDLFAVTRDGRLLQRAYADGRWTNWAAGGPTGFVGQLAANWDRTGRLHLFGIGAGSTIVHSVYTAGHGWTRTEVVGGPVRGNVSVVYNSSTSRFDLFAVGTDRRIHQRTAQNGSWTDWHPISGNSFNAGVAAVRIDGGAWRVVGVGGNRRLYQLSYSGRWSAPADLGGGVIGNPGAVWTGSYLRYVVIGTDGKLYERAVPGGGWTTVVPTPPTPDRVGLAKTLVSRWGGRLTGLPGVLSDLQATAAGRAIRNSSSCNNTVYLDARMLTTVVAATNRYRVYVNNMVTGHSCGSGYHPKGKAVDFNTIIDPATGHSTNWHSGQSGDDITVDVQFLTYVAAAVPSGGGAGQRYCAGRSGARLPGGMAFFDDFCNHQHLDSRP